MVVSFLSLRSLLPKPCCASVVRQGFEGNGIKIEKIGMGLIRLSWVGCIPLQFPSVSGAKNRWTRGTSVPVGFSGTPSMPESLRHRSIGSQSDAPFCPLSNCVKPIALLQHISTRRSLRAHPTVRPPALYGRLGQEPLRESTLLASSGR